MTINNHTVGYRDIGEVNAPAIIMIHGFPFNKSMWNEQMEALREECRVVAYDVRGHGESDAGDEPFSIELFVQDLLALMDALKIRRAMLCGFSMGGYIALNAIVNYPDRFNALVLSDTHCMADTPESKENRLKAIESLRENGIEAYADGSIEKLFAPESLRTKREEIAAVKEMILSTPERTVVKTLHALRERGETCSRLPEISVPVLILVGEKDAITPPSAAELMHEKIESSRLCVIEHAGHLSCMENPAAFINELKRFVAAVY
ncbi:alpha/beta fold hydrolase [Sulfurimonas sp. HSL3-7]|uniref:alpha/beta fold hydrolase n=1 Tax=Sulfonitrofixus jiaomeiensis TaxID=3131938 RepID=UPI0031F7DAA1